MSKTISISIKDYINNPNLEVPEWDEILEQRQEYVEQFYKD